jgi:hypothetical protein
MKIAIHQPEFIPWLAFFDKMKQADRYVILDHVQFKKCYFENRNRIKFENKAIWLTVPVKSKHKYYQSISDVQIDNSSNWQRKMLQKFLHCYGRSKYYNEIINELEPLVISRKYERLIDLNITFINWFRKIFEIKTPIDFSSNMEVQQYNGSDLILETCIRLGANHYICGASGKNYLRLNDFQSSGIEIIWSEFNHPQYPQLGENFIGHLSSLDYVFNHGVKNSSNTFGTIRN